jgi:hypothetical protein
MYLTLTWLFPRLSPLISRRSVYNGDTSKPEAKCGPGITKTLSVLIDISFFSYIAVAILWIYLDRPSTGEIMSYTNIFEACYMTVNLWCGAAKGYAMLFWLWDQGRAESIANDNCCLLFGFWSCHPKMRITGSLHAPLGIMFPYFRVTVVYCCCLSWWTGSGFFPKDPQFPQAQTKLTNRAISWI